LICVILLIVSPLNVYFMQYQNLRVTPKRKSVDSYGTGDYQHYNVFEVRADFPEKELNRKGIKYSQSVIDAGVVIETLTSQENANLLLQALQGKDEAAELIKVIQVLRKHIEDTDNDLRYDGMIVPKVDILKYCDSVVVHQ